MISIQNISKKFGNNIAVNSLSVEIDKGEVVGFLGPNGAGKTTTMRMVTNFYEPDEGEIYIDGILTTDNNLETKRRIGYLPENNPLYHEMLVCDYLKFISRLKEIPNDEWKNAIDYAVESTGLESVYWRPIGELSKGYKQRVGFAQAILNKPDILIMDEPTEGLDPNQRVEIRRLIKDIGKDKTIIVSSHVMQEIESTCNRVIIINKGALVADGSLKDIRAKSSGSDKIITEIEGTKIVSKIRELSEVLNIESSKTKSRLRLEIAAKPNSQLCPKIFNLAKDNNWTLWELRQEEVNLEDVFRGLTVESKEALEAS